MGTMLDHLHLVPALRMSGAVPARSGAAAGQVPALRMSGAVPARSGAASGTPTPLHHSSVESAVA